MEKYNFTHSLQCINMPMVIFASIAVQSVLGVRGWFVIDCCSKLCMVETEPL